MIQTIDFSSNPQLTYIECYNNQLTSLDLSKNETASLPTAHGNEYEIVLNNGTFDLSQLPAGFDITKTSEWFNGTVEENILTVTDPSKIVTYDYDCGKDRTITFILKVRTALLGDVNSDNVVNSSDASLILADYARISTGNASTFSEEQKESADINSDSKYDSTDASLSLAYYAYTSIGGTDSIEKFLADMN
jgi:hypothetical protein